uniref:Immunoglobulin V-set domain-containing protein n=1 Tax=Gasterosteus aculeatus aculeatus TaxID=481459 RepID=A0AAQ4NYY8_GASAC
LFLTKPVVAVTTGETVSIDCNLGTVTDRAAFWYKQIPGGVPQFVLYYHHSHSSPTYGTGFSSPKFTSTHQSTSDYLIYTVTKTSSLSTSAF